MGFFNKVMTKTDSVDLEDFLNNLDAVQEESYENADALVKPLDLNNEADSEVIIREVKTGNIALVNIADLNKRNKAKLKELLTRIKSEVRAIDGDMAGISAERILVTPSKVKIIKKKGQ
ncbi:MAG: cell division protein SepF [Candidatus Diapherotrites archaeon]|nr:cell division protein SepF [Candidatus Diapherotrites archaeon]